MKFQGNESFIFFLHLGLHLPHRFFIPLDSCMIATPVTTLSSFNRQIPDRGDCLASEYLSTLFCSTPAWGPEP